MKTKYKINLGIVNTTMTAFDKNTEAASPNHEIVEIESIGESLGSKYYEFDSKSRNLVDAEDKLNENKSNAHRENKKPEAIKKAKLDSKIQTAPKADEKLKLEENLSKNNVIAVDKDKNANLRVNSEENLVEKESAKPDTNGLKVQKIRVLPIRRMSVAEA